MLSTFLGYHPWTLAHEPDFDSWNGKYLSTGSKCGTPIDTELFLFTAFILILEWLLNVANYPLIFAINCSWSSFLYVCWKYWYGRWIHKGRRYHWLDQASSGLWSIWSFFRWIGVVLTQLPFFFSCFFWVFFDFQVDYVLCSKNPVSGYHDMELLAVLSPTWRKGAWFKSALPAISCFTRQCDRLYRYSCNLRLISGEGHAVLLWKCWGCCPSKTSPVTISKLEEMACRKEIWIRNHGDDFEELDKFCNLERVKKLERRWVEKTIFGGKLIIFFQKAYQYSVGHVTQLPDARVWFFWWYLPFLFFRVLFRLHCESIHHFQKLSNRTIVLGKQFT